MEVGDVCVLAVRMRSRRNGPFGDSEKLGRQEVEIKRRGRMESSTRRRERVRVDWIPYLARW